MRILAAEDNLVFQSVLQAMLTRWGYEVQLVQNGEQAWGELQTDDPPRLAVLDWMMPGLDGVEVCRRLRTANREPYVYVILLTARTDSQDLVEALEAGADDYLTKPFNAMELKARLRAGKRIVELQEQLLLAREALRQQAIHDGLTGLLNRSSILDVLHKELQRAAREPLPLSVLLVDFDHFKQINDTHGHLAGDLVLREAAARMKSSVRRYDSIGRYGGEEFLVVLPGCARWGAVAQADRLRLLVGAEPFLFAGKPLTVTCSVGAASRLPGDPADTDALIREADLGLYSAKDRGRNCTGVAGADAVVLHG